VGLAHRNHEVLVGLNVIVPSFKLIPSTTLHAIDEHSINSALSKKTASKKQEANRQEAGKNYKKMKDIPN
jgi:hypothetical protein